MIRRALDGLLLLDKPGGISSNTALQEVRRLYRAAKAGHAGTLDPLATGLLPVLFGEATKFSALLLEAEKEYLADVRLGIRTATGDAEGEVLEVRPVNVAAAQLEAALARFRGAIEQVPPMHSALKRGGRPLYRLAREGTEVERRPRPVFIAALELLGASGNDLRLRVRCSKGTYIRSLAADLGAALGTVAHLCALRRTAAGGYSVAEASSLEALRRLDEVARDALLRPLPVLLQAYPQRVLEPAAARQFAHGQSVLVASSAQGLCQVIGPAGHLLGVGEIGDDGVLRPVRLLARAADAANPGKNLVS